VIYRYTFRKRKICTAVIRGRFIGYRLANPSEMSGMKKGVLFSEKIDLEDYNLATNGLMFMRIYHVIWKQC
jgi:hypothetical protein